MLRIKLNSPVPIYEQMVKEFSRMISEKELKPGDELPTIRSLSAELEIAVNTVARAYRELERQGLIISNGRKGTFVNDFPSTNYDNINKIFKEPIRKLIKAGFDEKSIHQIFMQNLNQIFK